ncbi:hypothetical protein OUZ56_024770 [Daphnia magna]|uniref:Secreted protein n=1 Tax=Daphnia magna TaxID=35525 RepID=A0ABQ9ZHY1_9CRUS|nr:hypothetical protein OUZ56_024770 [Daphnia magna]
MDTEDRRGSINIVVLCLMMVRSCTEEDQNAENRRWSKDISALDTEEGPHHRRRGLRSPRIAAGATCSSPWILKRVHIIAEEDYWTPSIATYPRDSRPSG